MYTIGELVKLDEHITEQSVVQIDFYTEHERNLTLLKNFVFARSAPQGMSSNLDILHKLREASLTDARENIFCVIANYGQGKSHFGLVLANYFGRDVQSEEFRITMDKIAHAEGDEARVQNLRDFRQARKPYLVIRLRGDSPLPLNQQFLRAVQNALCEAGVDGKLPLWYQKAVEWLENLPRRGWEQLANEFLEQYNMDLPALIERVREFDAETHDLVNGLFRHLTDAHPDFQGGLEPTDLLSWLAKHYCGDNPQFGGMLILFDEFSQFVERYYAQRRHAGSLQRLLEAVDKLRPRVLFVAFAQHDPLQMLRHVMQSASQQQLEEAMRELQRLPEGNKLRLYTRMEQVIDGYLRQEDTPFAQLLERDTNLDDTLWEAGVLVRQVLGRRYSEQQQWTDEQFHEIVCKGCFPLHPLTTAVLSHGFRTESTQVDTPRTVLGFVLERVQRKIGEPAVTPEGKPNWIYAVDLVDYFLEMLPQQETDQYRRALQRIEGEPSSQQDAVLKAVLLISVAELNTRRENFVQVISNLSGLDESTVKHTLKQLAELFALYEEQGKYRFYPPKGDLRRLQQLRQEVWSEPISDDDVRLLNQRFQVSPEVNVPWGHRDDWEARQVIWLVRDFTERNLKREAPLFTVGANGLNTDAKRGLVIRLIALCEEEMDDLEQRVSQLLDQVFPDENAPAILVVLPSEPMPDLLRWVRWDNYLWTGMPSTDRQQIGEELIRTERTSAQRAIEQAKEQLLSDRVSSQSGTGRRVVVPKAYRVAVQQSNPQTVKDALFCLYRHVYRFAPPFFDQYHHGSSKLRRDIKQICIKLAEDKVREIVNTFGNQPGTDCVHKYLHGQWRILGTDYRIQPSALTPNVKKAWDQLEMAFSSKEVAVPVRDVLLRLMNPPYGYHFHQLALLFSAWYGYNRKQLELSIDGKLDSPVSIWNSQGVDRSERFIEQMVFVKAVTIKQRDTGRELEQVKRLVRDIISRTEYFSQEEAEEAISLLTAAQDRLEGPDEELREDIQRALKTLQEGIKLAKDYDRRAEQLLQMAQSGMQIRPLAEAYSRHELPDLGIVLPGQPTPDEIQKRLMERIWQRVEAACNEAERLSRLEDVAKYRDVLRAIISPIRLTRNQELEARVMQAIQSVEQRAEQLRQEAQEAPIIGEMRAMDVQSPLATLRRYRQRLEEMRLLSQEAQQLHQKTQQQIDQAIRQSEQRLRGWLQSFQEARDRATLERLLEEMRRYWAHYENTPEMKQVTETEEECEQVLRVLEQIEQIVRLSPTSPGEVDKAIEQLKQKSSQMEHLAVQNAVIEGERRLQEYAQRKAEEALRWLQQQEQDAQQGQGDALIKLLRQLDEPPTFLSDSEKGRLQRLKTTVQQRIDEDAVQSIRLRLRQIRDTQKLLQLREEIERLLGELRSQQGLQ